MAFLVSSNHCHQMKFNVSKWQCQIREMWEVQETETIWGKWCECLPKPLRSLELMLSPLSLMNTTPSICLLFRGPVAPVSLVKGTLVSVRDENAVISGLCLPRHPEQRLSWLREVPVPRVSTGSCADGKQLVPTDWNVLFRSLDWNLSFTLRSFMSTAQITK